MGSLADGSKTTISLLTTLKIYHHLWFGLSPLRLLLLAEITIVNFKKLNSYQNKIQVGSKK